MVLGLLMMAAGSLIFIPAANSRNYDVFFIGTVCDRHGPGPIADGLQSICHHNLAL
jgi:hypothetical protein